MQPVPCSIRGHLPCQDKTLFWALALLLSKKIHHIKSFYTIGPDSENEETKPRAPHQMKAGGSVFFLASFLMKIFTI